VFNLFFIVVAIELVNVSNELVEVSIVPNLVLALDVYEFKLLVAVCKVPIIVLFEPV